MDNKEMAAKLEKFSFILSLYVRNGFKEEAKSLKDRVTGQQFKVLMVLRRRQPCKTSDLSEAFSVSPGSMSIMLNSLVDDGFIERLHDDTDRRVILLRLTSKGETLVTEIYEKILSKLEKIVSKLSCEEIRQLNALIEKVQQMVLND